MRISTRNLATYPVIALLALNWFSSSLYPDYAEIALYLILVLFIVIFGFSRRICNPYLFFVPYIVYLGVNIYLSYYVDREGTVIYCYLLAVSIVAFNFTMTIAGSTRKEISLYPPRLKSLSIIFFLSCAFLVFIRFLLPLASVDLAKAFHLVFSPFLMAILWGAIASAGRTSPFLSFVFFLSYSSILLYGSLTSYDISRISFLEVLVLLWLMCKIICSKGSNLRVGLAEVTAGILILALFFTRVGVSNLGGDALIVTSAVQVIDSIRLGREHEPFMPIFNAFFVLIPDAFWFDGKPKLYNVSAWYLQNIQGINPSEYPYGVGISLIGASYLYGGVLSVVIVFSLIGLVFGRYLSNPKNFFELGFLCFFLFRLPFAIFRMDETFIFGAGFLSLLIIVFLMPRLSALIYPLHKDLPSVIKGNPFRN